MSNISPPGAPAPGEQDPFDASPQPYADGLVRAQPSSVGVDANEVLAFLDAVDAEGLEMHSFMLHRHGRVVAEGWRAPYRADRPRILHSTAKSFTACAVGLAIEQGSFALSDKVLSFFPEQLPAVVSENLAAMTVEDLLTMRTGQESETSGALWRGLDSSWIAEFFKIPVVHPPGSTYVYTSAASYMLSAILTKTTGETLHDFLKPRLFRPLGITGETWDLGPDGINPGGNGLTARTVDLLKLGVLHAQGGLWEGRQVLPESWVNESTRAHVEQGDSRYGYHWSIRPKAAFSALGIFVQGALVYRDHGAVIAVTGAMEKSRVLFPHVERHFPKAFSGQGGSAAADERLRARLATWRLPRSVADAGSALAARVSGVDYAMEPNARGISHLRVDFRDGQCVFELRDAEGGHSVTAGVGHWIEGRTDMPGSDLHHGYRLRGARVVASAGWIDEHTLEMTWIFAETAFRDRVVCRFDDDTIRFKRRVNVNMDLREHPELSGVAVRP
jgi:CubicO group peptidase (beta-lactamase class C family)